MEVILEFILTPEIVFAVWIICAIELVLFPMHPIVNAICLVLGVIFPAFVFAPTFELSDSLRINSVKGWIIVVILTLCGYLCNIFMARGSIMEEITENDKTFMRHNGISVITYGLSFGGTYCIAQNIGGLFA